jgi:hypothetical protein
MDLQHLIAIIFIIGIYIVLYYGALPRKEDTRILNGFKMVILT